MQTCTAMHSHIYQFACVLSKAFSKTVFILVQIHAVTQIFCVFSQTVTLSSLQRPRPGVPVVELNRRR